MKNFMKITAVGIVGYIVGYFALSYRIKTALLKAYLGEEESK